MTQEAAKKERVAKVIEVLNKARSMELYAVHQYMNQHYNLDDLDYGEFASKIKLIAIDEMRHAEHICRHDVCTCIQIGAVDLHQLLRMCDIPDSRKFSRFQSRCLKQASHSTIKEADPLLYLL